MFQLRRWSMLSLFVTVMLLVCLVPVGSVAGTTFPSEEEITDAKAGDLILKAGTYEIGGKSYRADYGTLVVPENRNKADSRLIQLPVIRIHATGDNPVEPVFLLVGGPGAPNVFSAEALASMKLNDFPYAWLLKHHDFVMVGYRGVDGSVSLNLPEVVEALQVEKNPLSSENLEKLGKAYLTAFQRLEKEGVDIDGYTMVEVIDDMEAAREGLGYEKINPYSLSYGTRIAYIYSLRYPDSIHRSLMVSVNPPGHFVWEPEMVDAQLRYYADLWEKDPVAVSKSPDLVKTMQNVLKTLPQEWQGFRVDPDKVKIITFFQLFHRGSAAQVFDAYVAAEEGDYSGLAYLSVAYDMMIPNSSNWGERASKAVSADYDPKRDYEAEMDPAGSIIGSPLSKQDWGSFQKGGWPIKSIPKEYRKLQYSDVETLLINGSVDLSTPVESARKLLPYFRNGKLVVLAEMGHVSDVENIQPEAFQHLVERFYLEEMVDDSKFTYQPMNFTPSQTFQDIAKQFVEQADQNAAGPASAERGNVYEDPAGRFTIPLVGDWTEVDTDETYALFRFAEPPLDMYIVTAKSSDLEAGIDAAVRQVDIDPAALALKDSGRFGNWTIFYYSLGDGKGVTVLAQVEDATTYCLIATGDETITMNPPAQVVNTAGGFTLAGEEVILPSTVDEFEAYINSFVGDRPPALSIAIVLGSEVIYSKGFGLADGPRGMVATPDTVYQWGSMAKMVTATAIMQLREKGLVDLDAPVSRYLDYFSVEYPITVRQLLSHSSGLPEPTDYIPSNLRLEGQSLPDPDLWTRKYLDGLTSSIFEPGSASAYSSPNSVILGQIVAEISGQSYMEYAKENILVPLGMKNTDFTYSSQAMVVKAAAGAFVADEVESVIAMLDEMRGRGDGADFIREVDGDLAWMNRFSVFAPAGGGLIGPVSEVIRFIGMHLNGGESEGVRILSPESVALMQKMGLSSKGTPLGFGLGWEVIDDVEHPYVEHAGGGYGIQDLMRIYPNEGFAIVIMSNLQGYDHEQVVDAAANVVFSMLGPATEEKTEEVGSTPPITDAEGKVIPGSIASLENITLGGIEQWILIRGKDTSKPLLLWLHGGPGFSYMPWVELFQTRQLEANFVVVQWDQRGAGKSFSQSLSAEDLQVEKFISDTLELTNMLRERFNQEKIFLFGHSWGSALGFLTIMENSEPYYAYIAAAEAADWNRRQMMSYQWVLEQARKDNNTEVIQVLESTQPFDPTNMDHIAGKNQFLDLYRGGDLYTEGLWDRYLDYVFSGKSLEYTSADVENFVPGMTFSQQVVVPQAMDYNLFRDFPVSLIPVHFFAGRHDHQTPGELAEEYYNFLEAPAKSFTWFENSGHSMIWDEVDKTTEELIKIANETFIMQLREQGLIDQDAPGPVAALPEHVYKGPKGPIAFVNVTVIPMDEERLVQGQTVIVKDGAITQMGPVSSTSVPAGATRIDGSGQYLIPALSDMHVHMEGEAFNMMLPPDARVSAEALDFSKFLFPYIANGVVTIGVMQALPEHVTLRDRIAGEEILGPRLILGRMIDGPERGWPPPFSTWVKTPAQARQAVIDAKKTGYDRIKVYSFLSQECYDSIITTAKELNMPVDGHIPVALSVEYILDAGQNVIAHAEEVMKHAGGDYSEERIDYFAEIIRESDTWITPTLVTTRAILALFDDPDRELARPEVRYLAPMDLTIWSFLINRYQGFSVEHRASIREGFELFQQPFSKALHDAGGKLMSGTDTLLPGLVPGFALQRELEELVRVGLTPYEALRTSTSHPMEFLGELHQAGTVEIGKRANLILLQASPLKDISNIRSITGVMIQGRWYPRSYLDEGLEEIARGYEIEKEKQSVQGDREIEVPTAKTESPVQVDSAIYDAYVGEYDYGNDATLTVTKEDDRLFAQMVGQAKYEIFPRSETGFFWKVVDAQIEFVKDEQGKVIKAIHRQDGREIEAPKIK